MIRNSARQREGNCPTPRMSCTLALHLTGRLRLKISIGKYNLTEPLAEFVKREIIANNLKVLPIDIDHTAEISTLPFHHKDPFDRMLVAQSMVENFPLVSRVPSSINTVLYVFGNSH